MSTFCDSCGQPTITKCQNCKKDIRGYYHIYNVEGHGYYPPSFCHDCGKKFPWTEAKLKAARELADELENVSTEEIEKLKRSLDDLVADTPNTTVAATRFKKIISKAGKVAAEGFRTILIDVLSETAKKNIWP